MPSLWSHNALGFVVDIVNWTGLGFAVGKVESPEHGYVANVHVVYLIIVVFDIEGELGLSDPAFCQIDDEVVIDYSFTVDGFCLAFIRDTDCK